MTRYEQWKRFQYYVIIGVISLIALFFLPMIGSEAGLQWNLPTTFVGWCVYVISKLLVATINILIFHCFVQQARVNIKDNEKYLEAQRILAASKINLEIPRAPSEYMHTIYGKKSVTIFVTTLLSAIGLTQAVLTFDWISMLTYFFTILMGLIFGVIQMNETEQYWTEEYWCYAKKIEKDMAEAEKQRAEQRDLPSICDSRDNILDTSVGAGDTSAVEPVVADSVGRGDGVLGAAADTGDSTPNTVYRLMEEDT